MTTRGRILVVDDDLGTRETFGVVLRLEQFDVTLAASAQKALEIVDRWTPDLVFCDLNLLDASAFDVLRGIRDKGICSPFIVVTGFSSVPSAFEAGRALVAEYVEKPVSPEQLVQLAHAHLVRTMHQVPVSQYATRATYVIEQRYAEPELNVRAVARAVGISSQHLSRVVKQQLDMTFTDLLRDVRLREANRLLQDATLSMKEIAFAPDSAIRASSPAFSASTAVYPQPRTAAALRGARCSSIANE